jgi:hypothetical protein
MAHRYAESNNARVPATRNLSSQPFPRHGGETKPTILSYSVADGSGRGWASRHLRPFSARNFPGSSERFRMVVISEALPRADFSELRFRDF